MNITPWKRKSRCQKPRNFFLTKITGQLKNIVFYRVEQARELSITKKGQSAYSLFNTVRRARMLFTSENIRFASSFLLKRSTSMYV